MESCLNEIYIGSGKSTLSKWILSRHPSFQRLSIDSYVYDNYGLYSIDYPAEKYSEYQVEAENELRKKLSKFLQEGSHDVILDFSFAFHEWRIDWKSLVERLGGRWVLVYLDVDAAELRRRVAARNQLAVKDADSAFPVTEEILESYIAGFEIPIGEGEIVLRI
jgi:predicted kinase